jgi:hypothetical protein
MILLRWSAILGLAVLSAGALLGHAQQPQRSLHIGYVYPAGGQQGSTFEAVIGGQFLTGVNSVDVSGAGVTARIVELVQPTSGKELNELRIQVDELLARKAVVKNDFRALEAFRSFKTAKTVKTENADEDKELEALKKKYAGATWTANDDATLNEIRKKISSAVRRPANPAIGELAVLQVTVAADAEPGQRELRIATPSALSNPLVFYVGQLPEFSAKPAKSISEQKSAVAKTAVAPKARGREPELKIALPAVINGQILPGKVDRYRFEAGRGQKLVVAAQARELIPYIADAVPGWFQATLAVYDDQGKELAYTDDYQFNPDPVLYCEIPADGEYVVEIKDAIYRGREDFVYRITLGELPFVTGVFPLGGPADKQTTVELTGWNLPETRLRVDNKDRRLGLYALAERNRGWVSAPIPFAVDALPECLEAEPNGQQAEAQQVSSPVIINGRIQQPDDVDVFCFEGRAGDQIVAEVSARRLNSPLDSVLKLTDAAGRQLAMNDDYEDKGAGLTTHQADSRLALSLPTDGKYLLRLTDMQHRGGPEYAYRLRISRPRPDFELRVVPPSISARAGASVPLTVYALRKDGFADEITLALKDAPPGFALSGNRLPGDKEQVPVTLSVPSASSNGPISLSLEGRATIQGREVSRAAVPAEDMMQAFAYRHLVPARELKVTVSGRDFSRNLVRVIGDAPTRIPAGGVGRILLGVPQNVAPERIDLRLSNPPAGISIQSVARSREGVAVLIQSDATKVKPGQKGNLILTATGKKFGLASSKAKPAKAKSTPSVTLPAVPYEIVGPGER